MNPKFKKAGIHILSASIGVVCLVFNASATTQPQLKDSTSSSMTVTTNAVTEKDMLIQELQRLNEMLAKATTEDEKKAIIEKIEYTKQRLATISGSTGTQNPADTAYRSEREILISQIDQLNKSLATVTSDTEKKAILDKIAALKQRLTQLDSGKVYQPPVVTSEKDMLIQELQRLNEMLAKATTEDEKMALAQKIEYTKQRLATISGSTGTQNPADTAYRSEREILILQIDQLNKSLAAVTSDTEKRAILDKIAALKQRLTQLDSGKVYQPPVGTSEKEMLIQELQRLNEMLAKATTEDEKMALAQKIEYTKQRLATISESTGTQNPADTAYKSEREILISQIDQLNKSLAAVTSDAEKKAILDKITALKQRLAQLDSAKVTQPPVVINEKEMLIQQIANLEKALSVATNDEDKKLFTEKINMLKQRLAQLEAGTRVPIDSAGLQKIASEIKTLDSLIIQKRIDLTMAIQNNQKEKASQLEQEITSLLEKKRMFESQLTANFQLKCDTTINKDSLASHDARIAELKQRFESQKHQLDSIMKVIAELKLKIEEAEKLGQTTEIQPLKNQLGALNEKANALIVSMEKINIEGEKLQSELQFKEAVSNLKDSAADFKTESDSLLNILKEKNKERLSLIKNNADAREIEAITDEILTLKEVYIKAQQKLDMVKTEINSARAENLITQKTLQVEKVTLVASENRNERGFYEVTMKQPENDTAKKINIQVKLNVLEQVNGEVEITEEFIDENPKGMNGLRAFDITPSVDLLMNLEDAFIELPFNVEDIQGTDIQKLAIYYLNPQKGWEVVQGCSVDVARKVVFARVTHFSVYGIFAEQSVSISHSIMGKPLQTSINTHNISSTIVFDFAIPVKSFVQLYIYSLNGKLVAKPIAGMYNEGIYSFKWDGKYSFRTSASTGRYIARLMTKDVQITKPFTIIK
jgi:heme exporter protein D